MSMERNSGLCGETLLSCFFCVCVCVCVCVDMCILSKDFGVKKNVFPLLMLLSEKQFDLFLFFFHVFFFFDNEPDLNEMGRERERKRGREREERKSVV